jgi:N-acetylmuramoyl-L-alanine amidase
MADEGQISQDRHLPNVRRRNFLAWSGLFMMIVSLAWREWLLGPDVWTGSTRESAVGQAFSAVILDPGHGGQDSGAMCGSIMEKDLALDIAKRVDRILQTQGLATVMTRVGDSYISLAERAALANRARDCVFVSIHFNEGNKPVSTGIETYYADHQIGSGTPIISWLPFLQRISTPGPNLESQSLAGLIQEALVTRTQAVNRGTKAEQFFVIANVRHPAVLVEGGFISNKDDMLKIGNSDYREQIATAISDGIVRYRDLLRQRQATLAVSTSRGTE